MARVAVITGGGSGIGFATARRLALEHGFLLCLAGRRAEALQSAAQRIRAMAGGEEQGEVLGEGWEVITIAADIGTRDDALRVIATVLDRFGRIDALVNNAGAAPLVAIGDMTPEQIEQAFAVNALGPAWMINAAWPAIVKQGGGGRVVCVSTMGTRDPFPGFFAYAASKAAVNSYARSIAREGAKHEIRGFAIAPAAVETEMLRGLFSEERIPREACLAPDDVARVIVECATGVRDDQNGETIWLSR